MMIQLGDFWLSIHTFKYAIQKFHSLIWMDFLWRKPRRILPARVLESSTTTLLERLNLSPKPRENYCCSSHAFTSLSSNPFQQWLHFSEQQSFLAVPPLEVGYSHDCTIHGTIWGAQELCQEEPTHDYQSKPLGFPVTNLTAWSIWNVHSHHFKMKLKIGTPTVATFLKFGHGFRKNRLLKRSKWG